jgi:bifunctional non-homologous end joining protein LigD
VTGPFERLSDRDRPRLRKRRHPPWTSPMSAVLTEERFSGPDWIFERKLDGVRLLGFRHGRRVRLLSRNRKDQGGAYPEIEEALAAQAARDFVVDGEVVAFEGKQTSFPRLQGRMHLRDPERARRTGIAVWFYLFDLIHLEGHDLSALPLRARKSLLRDALAFRKPLRFLPHRSGDGQAYLEDACYKGWEGLIAKRASAPYTHARSRDWLKWKCVADQELVVVGFTDPQGSRKGFGALLVGYHEDGDLVYAGKVGTGYTEAALRDLRARMEELEVPDRPVDRAAEGLPRRGVHWIRPELVAQIGFTEWTSDGRLRHPRFLGLREDKQAGEVVRERPA